MPWHIRPKDDAWLAATLASARALFDRLWLHCGGCSRSYTVLHDELVAFHRLSPATPFLLISEALRCVSCGAKKGGCRTEPYGKGERREVLPVIGSPAEGPQPQRRCLQPESEPPRMTWPDIPNDELIDF